jgi:hypothetical protein
VKKAVKKEVEGLFFAGDRVGSSDWLSGDVVRIPV